MRRCEYVDKLAELTNQTTLHALQQAFGDCHIGDCVFRFQTAGAPSVLSAAYEIMNHADEIMRESEFTGHAGEAR